jgi:hypothetical protein
METSEETERKFGELKKALFPLGKEATEALLKIGVKFPESKNEMELKEIREKWQSFVQSLAGEGASGNLNAFIRSACDPVAVEGDTLVLGFYYAFHKAKIEDPKYTAVLERKLRDMFGKPYKIRCILVDTKTT